MRYFIKLDGVLFILLFLAILSCGGGSGSNSPAGSTDVSMPDLVGHWALKDSFVNLQNNAVGAWRGTWFESPETAVTPEFVTEGDRTGLHFRYTANVVELIESGDWFDPEKNGTQSELNISDYVTVSFWIFWDTDTMKDYHGNNDPEGNQIPDDHIAIAMNIISKSVWFKHGWQIRYDQSWASDGGASVVKLYIHHNGTMETLPIITNFTNYRGQWVNIAVSIDNVKKEVFTYVNGVATGASPQTYTTSFVPVPGDFNQADPGNEYYTGHLAIGSFSHPWGGFSVNGKMSDVRIYHGLIDDVQAKYLYNLK